MNTIVEILFMEEACYWLAPKYFYSIEKAVDDLHKVRRNHLQYSKFLARYSGLCNIALVFGCLHPLSFLDPCYKLLFRSHGPARRLRVSFRHQEPLRNPPRWEGHRRQEMCVCYFSRLIYDRIPRLAADLYSSWTSSITFHHFPTGTVNEFPLDFFFILFSIVFIFTT